MSKAKYMIRLVDAYTEEVQQSLAAEGMNVVHHDAVLPNFIIVETVKSFDEVKANPLFKSVEKERIGRLDI